MADRPEARDLLDTAREALLRKLLPALPGALHYEVRMIANAIAIAAREIELAPDADRLEWEQIMNLLGEPAPELLQQPVPADEINRARRKLGNAIRDGLFDLPDERQQVLLATLTRIVHAKLAISNPKALAPRPQ